MRTQVLILVAVVAGVQGGQLYASAPLDRGQYHRTSQGRYNYGYNTGDGVAKVEVRRKDGSVVGSYRYFDPNGKQIVRSYVADSKGFRILGNDLPISPEVPAAAILGAPALTAPVEGAADSVVESSVSPSKKFDTVDIERINANPLLKHFYQQRSVYEQQNALLRQQQKLIEEQKRQLAAYRSGNGLGQGAPAAGGGLAGAGKGLSDAKDGLPTPGLSVSDVGLTGTGGLFSAGFGDFNVIDDPRLEDYPSYYYYPHRYDYDFPAGFAFAGGVVVRAAYPSAVGARLQSVQEPVAAGKTHGERIPPSPLQVVPRYSRPYRPRYVVGRT